jgi:alpha-glucosidase
MKKTALSFFLTLIVLNSEAQKYIISSPDEKIIAEIEIGSEIKASVSKNANPVMDLSGMKLDIAENKIQTNDLVVRKIKRNSVNEIVYPQIHSKSSQYLNLYNELILNFRSGMVLTFRLFNEGLAYRFSSSLKDSLIILKETLDIRFNKDDSIRFQASENFNSAWETPYEFNSISDLLQGKLCNLPVLIQKNKGPFVMITESDLYSYPGLWVKGTGEPELIAANPPYPKKLKYEGSPYNHGQVAETNNFIAKVTGDRTFPWRIFAISDNEDGLISNNMVYLLASPTAIQDVSWIKPGVVMFDWWAKSNIYGVDFKSGINTETAKYFIDFCSAYGFKYFLFDDGWCPRDNLLREIPGLSIPEVTAYAKTKGVDVMLWVIWSTLQKQWDQAFDQFEKWGISGIKMDFMNRDDQQMVEFYEKTAAKAAEKKMVLDYHGAYKPSGLSRKYPNLLTCEALIEFEYNGWTTSDNPEHHNLLPYIRMFAGPMDYIPGTMRNSTSDNFRPIGDYPMGQGTRAHSMALFIILSSPMEMLPDSPSDYYREKECTDFISGIPVEWDETRLLKGKIAKYTVLARRSGGKYYIGAITNKDERDLELSTDFLKKGKYKIEAIEDGINANSRAEDYKKTEKTIQSGDIIKIKLAKGGGWTGIITPLE